MAKVAQPSNEGDELGRLLDWAGALTGGRVIEQQRLPTVRPAWKIRVQGASGAAIDYVLRCARPAGFGLAAVYTLPREAAVVAAIGNLAMPIPRVIGVHAEPEAMLLEFMPGDGHFAALDAEPARKARIVDHFIELLAVLHNAKPAQLGLNAVLPQPDSPRAHALMELDSWEKLYRDAATGEDDLLLFALGWLRRNAPNATRTVLVQGDTGPNQCLFNGERITAVLDWELAHFGDPMEDLGWIAARSFFMDFGNLRQLFARYSALADIPLDTGKIHYYRIMALVKCAIATGLARASMLADDDIAAIVSWDAVNRMALAISFMDLLGEPMPAAAPLSQSAATDSLYALIGRVLRDESARAADAFQAGRYEGLAQIVDYLAVAASQRERTEDIDGRERNELLQRRGATDLTTLIKQGESRHDAALARYFYRREQHHIGLLQRALGRRVQCLVEPID